jgi:hypothetical protein
MNMFGRKTKRQLVRASEIITEALETAKALASRLEETERQRSETMGLLKQSLANADGLLATVAKWRQLYEEAQSKPDAVSVCDETPACNGWVN